MKHGLVDGAAHRLLRLLLYLSSVLRQLLFLGERDDGLFCLELSVDLDLLESLMKLRMAAFDIVSRRITRIVDTFVGVSRFLFLVFPRFFGELLLVLDEIQPLLCGPDFVN